MSFVINSKLKIISIFLLVVVFIVSLPFLLLTFWYNSLRNFKQPYENWGNLYEYRFVSSVGYLYNKIYSPVLGKINPKIRTNLLVPESKYPVRANVKGRENEYEYSWMGNIVDFEVNSMDETIFNFTVKTDSGEMVKFRVDTKTATLWEADKVNTEKWTYHLLTKNWDLNYFKGSDRVKVLFKEGVDYGKLYKNKLSTTLDVTNVFVIRI